MARVFTSRYLSVNGTLRGNSFFRVASIVQNLRGEDFNISERRTEESRKILSNSEQVQSFI